MSSSERFDVVGTTPASGEAADFERRVAVVVVVTPFLGILAAIYLVWGWGVGWVDLALLVVLYTISIIGIDTGYHRLFSHRSFETTSTMRVLFAAAGSLAAQAPVLYWAALHRVHHRFSDTMDDPHSPHFHGPGIKGLLLGLFHAQMGWLFVHRVTDWGRYIPDLLRDRPVLRVHRLYFWLVLAGLLTPTVLGGLLTWSWMGALTGFIWGGLVRIFFGQHVAWSVNSICHYYGAQPFASDDEARNNGWLAIPSLGGSWHNNHHAFPSSALHGLRWWEVDLSGLLIRTLARLGLAWNVKAPTENMMAEKRTAVPAGSAS
jgi:stearoyl-CoA desaturase (delta-9 desaturase)